MLSVISVRGGRIQGQAREAEGFLPHLLLSDWPFCVSVYRFGRSRLSAVSEGRVRSVHEPAGADPSFYNLVLSRYGEVYDFYDDSKAAAVRRRHHVVGYTGNKEKMLCLFVNSWVRVLEIQIVIVKMIKIWRYIFGYIHLYALFLFIIIRCKSPSYIREKLCIIPMRLSLSILCMFWITIFFWKMLLLPQLGGSSHWSGVPGLWIERRPSRLDLGSSLMPATPDQWLEPERELDPEFD